MKLRVAIFGLGITIFSASALTLQPVSAATGVMDDSIYSITHPTTKSSLTTPYLSEVESASQLYGYTTRDTVFLASLESGSGLVPAKRLYKASTVDWVTESDSTKISQAVAAGYVDQGVRYYVSSVDTAATQPVYRFVKNGKHAYAMTPTDISAYLTNGYTREGISYYAIPTTADKSQFESPNPVSPAEGDGRFTLAVLGDTQDLSYAGNFDLYKATTDDIVRRKSTEDIRFALSVGDIISDGVNAYDPNRDPGQVTRAADVFNRLRTGSVPYMVAAGNHDTAAVCRGGSACPSTIGDGLTTRQRLRDTRLLSEAIYPSIAPQSSYVAGRFENSYKTFSAEGTDWMVISVEFYARRGALDWAKAQIAAHPNHNVIVVSHMLFNSDMSVSGSKEYGDLPASTLFNELGSYPNVKMMFSGHIGTGYQCKDNTAIYSGRSHSVFGCTTAFHNGAWNPGVDFNPVRFLTIDVNNGTVSSKIRNSAKQAGSTAVRPNYESLDATYSGFSFIR